MVGEEGNEDNVDPFKDSSNTDSYSNNARTWMVFWPVSLMFGRYDCGTAWLKQLCTKKQQQSVVLANGPVSITTRCARTNPVSDIVKELLYYKYTECNSALPPPCQYSHRVDGHFILDRTNA